VERPALEVAAILRDQGPGWRAANRGRASLAQLKVIEARSRPAAPRRVAPKVRRSLTGAPPARRGHVARCENAACGHTHIAYNSCRDRHCPKCQSAAAREWLADDRPEQPCPCCGGRMRIIEIFEHGCIPRYQSKTPAVIRIDTS
jgi:hypothetical protein